MPDLLKDAWINLITADWWASNLLFAAVFAVFIHPLFRCAFRALASLSPAVRSRWEKSIGEYRSEIQGLADNPVVLTGELAKLVIDHFRIAFCLLALVALSDFDSSPGKYGPAKSIFGKFVLIYTYFCLYRLTLDAPKALAALRLLKDEIRVRGRSPSGKPSEPSDD